MSPPTCPRCGAPVARAGAACERCLLELALPGAELGAPDPGAAEPEPTPSRRPLAAPASPAELAPLFPELEVEALLGSGGMGAVYRARQTRLQRPVALKLLHAELSADPRFVERFLREARALARLAHPGIVAVHDFGELGGRCYLVMELVEGTRLRDLMRARALAPREALEVVKQLCDALQYAHDEGVVHRDVKPENVLVDRRGAVKVADFGLAKLVGPAVDPELTGAGQVMGTPVYMAPEQLERPRDVDHRADIYSLGVVFYELLTGELPLGRFAPPSQRVEVDVRLDEIVLKSLERERERRYQHASQVRTDVDALGKQAAPERAASPAGAVRPGARREPRRLGVRGALAALAASTAAWLGAAWALGLGPLGCALGTLPLAAGSLLVLVERRTAPPVPRERAARLRWRAGATLAALAAAGAVLAAHLALFERWTWHYVAGPQLHDAGAERVRSVADELLARVAPVEASRFAELDVSIDAAHWTTMPSGLLAWPPLALAAGTLALAVLAALAAARAGVRSDRAWRGGVVEALALWLGGLALAHLLAGTVQGWGQELAGVSDAAVARGEADEIAGDLYRALLERGLVVHAETRGRILDRRNRFELARWHTLAATPPSPFDRWRTSWRGPERVLPHLLVVVVSSAGGDRAWIAIDGGLVERGSAEEAAWRADLARLLALGAG